MPSAPGFPTGAQPEWPTQPKPPPACLQGVRQAAVHPQLAGFGATVTSPPPPPVPVASSYLFAQPIVIDDPPPEPLIATSSMPVFGGMPSSSALLPPKAAAKPPPPKPVVTSNPFKNGMYILWQVRLDHGWADYEPDFAHELERHHQAANPTEWKFFSRPGQAVLFEYHVNYPMYQMNTETRRKRQVRRVFHPKDQQEAMEDERAAIEAENESNHTLEACYVRRGKRPSRSASRSRSQARR